jgi:hypothetical protein
MKRSLNSGVLAVLLAAWSPSLLAQWPLHPSAAVPKGPDGKPNLSAPAPRTPDGKPDLSGIWLAQTNEPNGPPPGRPPLARFNNAGAGFKEGLPLRPWAAELRKKRAADLLVDNPDGQCLPQGLLQYHLDPQPRKVVQTPEQILIIFESNYGLRTIYTDGRALPPQGEPQPFWYGYSAGRWESDTLVVETNNLRGVESGHPSDGWLDTGGSPLSDAAKITERFRRLTYGQLEIEFTVDDPKTYTKPFTVRVAQQIVADGSEMIEFICHENQQFLKRVKVNRAPQ